MQLELFSRLVHAAWGSMVSSPRAEPAAAATVAKKAYASRLQGAPDEVAAQAMEEHAAQVLAAAGVPAVAAAWLETAAPAMRWRGHWQWG